MTLTQLEALLVKERKNAHKEGMFGLDECRKSIEDKMKYSGKSLFEIYTELIKRAMTDIFFNLTMIVACEQMIEELKK